MAVEHQILEALRRAIARAGGKPELAKQLGMYHSRINCFDNGSRKVSGMTVATLEKLFPDLKLYFFREDWPGEKGGDFRGAELTGVQLGDANRMKHVNIQPVSEQGGGKMDEPTRMLLNYWEEMPMSQRFELLAHLAERKEKKRQGQS